MAENKDAFVCYRSYVEAIKVLPQASRWTFFEKIMSYALDGTVPAFSEDIETAMFKLMKANLDSCDQRYRTSAENGRKGGRPRKENGEKKPNSKPKNNLTENLKITYQNPNDNVNVNETLSYVSEEGALSAPPPSGTKNEERFEMCGKLYEYYIAENGERRARPV